MNGVSNLDETYRQYSQIPCDDLIRFWRSKVKVTAGPWSDAGIHFHLLVHKIVFDVTRIRIIVSWWVIYHLLQLFELAWSNSITQSYHSRSKENFHDLTGMIGPSALLQRCLTGVNIYKPHIYLFVDTDTIHGQRIEQWNAVKSRTVSAGQKGSKSTYDCLKHR